MYWKWTLENWFGSPIFLCFLIVSVIVGCFHRNDFQENLYLATWSFPFLLYALFFVAPKPDHYIFPALMPIFLTVLDVPQLLLEKWKELSKLQKGLAVFVLCAITVLLFMQVRFSMMTDIPTYQEYLRVNM